MQEYAARTDLDASLARKSMTMHRRTSTSINIASEDEI